MTRWIWLQAMALAMAMCWPMPLTFAVRAIGHPAADGPKHLWTLWWMREELLHGEPGMLTRYVNFPDGMPLYPIEPSNALVSLILPLPPIPLSNLLALVHITLLGVFSGWLGWTVTGRRLGAHTTAALVQCSAFAAFTLQVGVGELRQVWWIPLGLTLAMRARDSGALRDFLALGLGIAGATLSCFYHGFFLAIAVAVYALCTLRFERRLLRGYAAAVAVAVAIVVIPLRVFDAGWARGTDADALVSSGRITRDYSAEAMQPQQLVMPRFLDRDAAPAGARAYDGGRYLGLVALALAGAGVAIGRRRAAPWAIIGVTGVVLSLGTVLHANGEAVRWGGMRLVLPLGWVYDGLSVFVEPPNFPARFIVLTSIGLAVLAGIATERRWVFLAIPLALLDIGANDLVGWPRETFAPADMRGLGDAVGTGAVADLSVFAFADKETRGLSMAAQMELRRPIQAVQIERVDRWATSGNNWLKGLEVTQNLGGRHGDGAPAMAADYRADAWLLRDRGFDRVLLTSRRTGFDGAERMLMERAFGEPIAEAKRGLLWAIPEVTASPEEIARWRATLAARVPVTDVRVRQ